MRESEYLIPSGDILNRLKNVPTLSSFKTVDLQILIQYSKIQKYDPEEIIIEEGKRDTWLFFIISGKVKSITSKFIGRLRGYWVQYAEQVSIQ